MVVVRSVSGVIVTAAGNGTAGYEGDNGLATAAELHFPGAGRAASGHGENADTADH